MLNGSWQLWHGFGEWGDHRKGRMQKSTVARNGKTHFIAQQFPSSVHSQTTNGGRPGRPKVRSARSWVVRPLCLLQRHSWKADMCASEVVLPIVLHNIKLSIIFNCQRSLKNEDFRVKLTPKKILGFHHVSSHLSLICTRCITSKRKPRMIKVPR